MRSFNKVLTNLILPILILFMAFKFNVLLGWLLILGFVLYAAFKSRGDIYAYIGNLKYMRGNEKGAIKWIGHAAKFKNCQPRVLTAYSFLLLKNGDREAAEKYLEIVINSKASIDEKQNARVTMAIVEWKKGRLYYAINALEDIYRDFKNTNLYSYLGFLYIAKGDYERALQFNLEALEYNNSSSLILNNLGLTYYLLGRYDESQEIYVKFINNDPIFAEAYYYYGILLLKKNNKEEARKNFNKSLTFANSLLTIISKEDIEQKISGLDK